MNQFSTSKYLAKAGALLATTALFACTPTPQPIFSNTVQNFGVQHKSTPPKIHLPPNYHTVLDLKRSDQNYIQNNNPLLFSAPIAVEDTNGDGLPDIFLPGGLHEASTLYINKKSHFTPVKLPFTRKISSQINSILLVDINADQLSDIVIGTIRIEVDKKLTLPAEIYIYQNRDNNNFSLAQKIKLERNAMSISMADFDNDRDLDLAVGQWGTRSTQQAKPQHLWENKGGLKFVPYKPGIAEHYKNNDYTFTPTLSDIDNDNDIDVLFAADFESSQVFRNQAGLFENITDPRVISDDNGMGAAAGDYDNDGDIDWLVTSIYDPYKTPGPWGHSGNKLYANDGKGVFTDVSKEAGIQKGNWGWSSCMADFNNDGWLDIFHNTGYGYDTSQAEQWKTMLKTSFFTHTPPKLFISDKNGRFRERAIQEGMHHRMQGRGVSCVDFDRDGDIDIISANLQDKTIVYENNTRQLGKSANFVGVKLRAQAPNSQAIGAKVLIKTSSGEVQIREIQAGNNFLSHNPAEAHFGIGNSVSVLYIDVTWPGQPARTTRIDNPQINQWHLIKQ